MFGDALAGAKASANPHSLVETAFRKCLPQRGRGESTASATTAIPFL